MVQRSKEDLRISKNKKNFDVVKRIYNRYKNGGKSQYVLGYKKNHNEFYSRSVILE